MLEHQGTLTEITAACWKDNGLKARFLADPKGVLAEHGIEAPAHLNVKVVENTDDTVYITLPARSAEDILSDDEIHSGSRGALVPTICAHSGQCSSCTLRDGCQN